MTLRPMESADVAFLTDLWVASWREALPEIDFESRRGWLVGFLADPLHRTLIAAGRAGPLGFASVETAHLHQLVVAPGAKGSGVAVRLLNAMKAMSAALTLDVNQANRRAVRFYEREGFIIERAGKNPASGLATWRMCWRHHDDPGS